MIVDGILGPFFYSDATGCLFDMCVSVSVQTSVAVQHVGVFPATLVTTIPEHFPFWPKFRTHGFTRVALHFPKMCIASASASVSAPASAA